MLHHPESLNPNESRETITKSAAGLFEGLADAQRKFDTGSHDRSLGVVPRQYTDLQVAKSFTLMVFCMFGSDVGLLPQALSRA